MTKRKSEAKADTRKRASSKTMAVIHDGKVTHTEPAQVRRYIDQDTESDTYGQEIEEVLVEEKEIASTLPKGTRLGDYLVGTAYTVPEELGTRLVEERGFRQVDAAEATGEARTLESTHADEERDRAMKRQRAAGIIDRTEKKSTK